MSNPAIALGACMRALNRHDEDLVVEVNPIALFLLVLAVDKGMRVVPIGSPMEETLVAFMSESLLRLEELEPGLIRTYLNAGGCIAPDGYHR